MRGVFAGRSGGGVETKLEVIVLPGNLVPEQQGTVHVELYPEVERQGGTSIGVQSVTVGRPPAFGGILGKFAIWLGKEVFSI